MINWNIAGNWMNWVIVFLMISIPATIIHYFLIQLDGDANNG